jgi:hypothetical protein
MYHLLSGKLPFQGESSMDCVVGRITGQAIPIGEVVPGLPPRLVQSIEKLMATNPEDRYQTAGEAAAALRSLLRPKTAAPASSTPPEAAVAPMPAPVRQEETTIEAPLPPVRAETRLPKRKSGSARSRGTSRGTKASVVLAAVAVAAVALIGGTVMLFRSSNTVRPASQEGTAVTNKNPVLPPGGADTNKNPVLPPGGAVVRPPSLVIENPEQGAEVGMREDLTGRIESEGWPVIFIQADIPGQPWWSQAPVEKVDHGRFSTHVIFGDELTPSGTRFRIAGIVTRTREEALKFPMGSRLQALPGGFPQSVEVVVTHR